MDKTHAVLFNRCKDVHIEGIGIRGGSWWQTLFLLTQDASATHVSLLGKSVNTDGIDIDGVERFVARHCFIRCEDDGFGWHAVDAQTNGEPPTRDCVAEDCVIWNTRAGNGLRIGASMETKRFENITFRNIDVLEHVGAAICSDHSDWATCRNIRFENFVDETPDQTVDIHIAKTRYTNNTGFRDDRGHYDGLHFVNVTSPAGGIRLRGHDADHLIKNVTFKGCSLGGEPVDGIEDIDINEFVGPVTFERPDSIRSND
jgi:polygalacturonase